MSTSIIPSMSDYEKLLEEVRACRARIIELTAQRDDLLYHICPALQAFYEEKLGYIGRQLLAARICLKEKLRTIELLQAQINRQEKPSFEEAQKKAQEEFREYQEELRRKAEEAEKFRDYWEKETQWSRHEQESKREKEPQEPNRDGDANREKEPQEPDRDQEAETEKEICDEKDPEIQEDPVHELKRLYRQLVKRLHPDENPKQSDREKELFFRTQKAFRTGDLEELRKIWEEVSGTDIPADNFEDTEAGRQKIREILVKLHARIEALEQEIRQIMASFPYTMKPLLEDEEALENKRRELESQLKQVRKQNAELDKYIEHLKEKVNGLA